MTTKPEVQDRAIALIREGKLSFREIAETVGVKTPSTITRLAHSQGIYRKAPKHKVELLHILRRRRKAKGLLLLEVEKVMGYASGYLQRLEHNRHSPTLNTLLTWVEVLGGELHIEWVRDPLRLPRRGK